MGCVLWNEDSREVCKAVKKADKSDMELCQKSERLYLFSGFFKPIPRSKRRVLERCEKGKIM
jgi:hypothetical protein